MPEEQADAAEEHFLLKGSLAQASVTGNTAAKKQSHSEKVEICICAAFLICDG